MEYFTWNADPILIKFGFLEIRWYGLLFAGSIFFGLMLFSKMFKREKQEEKYVDKLFYYVIIGIIVGARLGHCLLYDPKYYLNEPIKILKIWEGGLASHGGILGIFIAIFLFHKFYPQFSIRYILDRLAVPSMFGATMIRLGNFFNSEIIGISTSSSLGIIFKKVSPEPRFPAQLYEALAYFIIFIILLFSYYRTNIFKRQGFAIGFTMTSVFIVRFLIEFIKERQTAFDAFPLLSIGQILSIPFIILGIVLILKSKKID